MSRHPLLLDRTSTVLIVVDLQEPFLRGIHDPVRLLANCSLLIQSATILGVPIVPTVQYAERMGSIVPEIAALLPAETAPIDKLQFSCAQLPAFLKRLTDSGRRQVLLCGVETHICVSQTALDLSHLNFQVHCAADAVSSRTMERHKLGMEKIRDAGVLPCAAEGAVFELLQEAGTAEFKAIHRLSK